jgi:hypothetical protein
MSPQGGTQFVAYQARIGQDGPQTPLDVYAVAYAAVGKSASLPLTLFTADVAYASALVPFTTRYSACLIKQTDTSSLEESPGTLHIITNGGTSRLFVSGGDGLNLGLSYIVPDLVVRNVNVRPDNYGTIEEMKFECEELEFQMETPHSDVSGKPEEKVGTVMVELEEQKVSVADVKADNAYQFVGQPQLNFRHFMERPQLLTVVHWPTTAVTGTTLFSEEVPHDLLQNTAATARLAFQLFKSDVSITVKVNGTRFHAGRLICYFVPLSTSGEAELTHSGRRASCTWLPHVFVDAQASASATLNVPYRNIAPFLNSMTDNYGAILIDVFSPLGVGTGGQTSLPVSVFVSFKDAELRVIQPYVYGA